MMSMVPSNGRSRIDDLCVNTIRTLAMDAVQKAKSGHPGAPMGLAPAAYALWVHVLKHNPRNPEWHDRDRFILSCGHASMLLYSLLYLTGYNMSLDDIKAFRQWESKTPGHPEFGCAAGVETTTGPLGQGFANAVGMALAERHLASVFNRPGYDIVDHFTYVMCGDGDLMEGITSESASFAGHTGLARLICLYDDNEVTIEGKTGITFTEDVALRFKSYNWQVLKIKDGNDIKAVLKAIKKAKNETERPSLIILRTHIAYGSPNKQDSSDAHGAPLGEEEIILTKKKLGWPEDRMFYVPEEALKLFRSCIEKGRKAESMWQEYFASYRKEYPELADRWTDSMKGRLDAGWDNDLPDFSKLERSMATRSASGMVLNAIAEKIHGLIGGSADLAPSNNTIIKSARDFQKMSYDGRNIRFGVREHAMGGILTGIALHKGLIPYGGTFLVFSDYMRPAIRLASFMARHVIYIFTHDSIAVGEDGPTHQPVEHLAVLRAIPGLVVIRPADASETTEAWRQAIKINGPVALILSRQELPVINRSLYGPAEGLAKGAYTLADCGGRPDIIIIATGSEVHIAIAAWEQLKGKGVQTRLVNMPSQELFERNPQEYRDQVLLPEVRLRLIVEAGVPMGWEKYAGENGSIIGINRFGASAPGGILMKKFGFTPENIVQRAMELLDRWHSA
jgi:transketolase